MTVTIKGYESTLVADPATTRLVEHACDGRSFSYELHHPEQRDEFIIEWLEFNDGMLRRVPAATAHALNEASMNHLQANVRPQPDGSYWVDYGAGRGVTVR